MDLLWSEMQLFCRPSYPPLFLYTLDFQLFFLSLSIFFHDLLPFLSLPSQRSIRQWWIINPCGSQSSLLWKWNTQCQMARSLIWSCWLVTHMGLLYKNRAESSDSVQRKCNRRKLNKSSHSIKRWCSLFSHLIEQAPVGTGPVWSCKLPDHNRQAPGLFWHSSVWSGSFRLIHFDLMKYALVVIGVGITSDCLTRELLTQRW